VRIGGKLVPLRSADIRLVVELMAADFWANDQGSPRAAAPRVQAPEEVKFQIAPAMFAFCPCGVRYRIDAAHGQAAARIHEQRSGHKDWKFLPFVPWRLPPETTIEAPGDVPRLIAAPLPMVTQT
jgi:hypothetical protein